MKFNNIFKESARDVISLGSPVFFLLVLVRILITENFAYLSRFLIAGILLFALLFFIRANSRAALGIIILIFVSVYYGDLKFAIFATAIYILAVASMIHLKHNKMEIFKGFVLGLICAGIGYYSSSVMFGIQ